MTRGLPLSSSPPRALWPALAALTVALALLATLVHPLVALAVGIALAAAPFVLASVETACLVLVAVITLLPFGALRLGIGFNPTLLDPALVLLYAMWLFGLIYRRDSLRWPPLSGAVAVFLGLMLTALLVGMVNGAPTKNQLRNFAELLLGAGLYFVIPALVPSAAGRRRLLWMLVGCGALSALVGLMLYALPRDIQILLLSALRVLDYPEGPGVLRFLNDDPSRLQRATGTSVDPNSFGGLLAVIAALLLGQFAPSSGRRRSSLDREHPEAEKTQQNLAEQRSPPETYLGSGRVLPGPSSASSYGPGYPLTWVPSRSLKRLVTVRTTTFAVFAVISLALLATVSRGSLVGLAAAIVVVGMVRDRRLLALGLLAGTGGLALAQFLPWTQSYMQHFVAGLTQSDRATQMRLGEYNDALRLIERYPWFGVGFGSPKDVDLYRGVSSLYLILAATIGLVGLASFLVAVGAALWRMARRAGSSDVALGALAALTAALVSGLFDHYFFTYPHAFALFWLVMALGVGASREAELGAVREPVPLRDGRNLAPTTRPAV